MTFGWQRCGADEEPLVRTEVCVRATSLVAGRRLDGARMLSRDSGANNLVVLEEADVGGLHVRGWLSPPTRQAAAARASAPAAALIQ